MPNAANSVILLQHHCLLVTVSPAESPRYLHATTRAQGLLCEYILGSKLLMSSLINSSSVLRTFVDNTEKPLHYHRGDSVVVFQYYQHMGDANICIGRGGESTLFGIHGLILAEMMIRVGKEVFKTNSSFIINISLFPLFYFVYV